ncbi:hypothetical protein MTER_40040 [Mycolicibacter terrae]|jgi:hypothetical protein|uniref:ESX-1 secretion-associated protein n=1 Tax=Mycolicibacter terrae TaxID=1788 RepID=A0AAD1HZI7_9MYCO|nr:type VII secretion target [Mycolicibacter terrae]ORW98376.1 hypothetical protein AWC28_00035 [Mycolicibacter terrae]BBX24593.1 hypothetical protein MTER_40040 [Mycolicibacter terrae]SNV52948.1 Protein of uncharacterised function (DUF2580) [Mycolicibacter terrae]
MPEKIHVDQGVLTNAAGNHRQASEYLATVTASHEGIQTSLGALGPIYGDFRRAAGELLDARKDCYDDQSSEHGQVSDNLNLAVATWNKHEEDAAKAFRHLTDGR